MKKRTVMTNFPIVLFLTIWLNPADLQSPDHLPSVPHSIESIKLQHIKGIHIRNHTDYELEDPIVWFCLTYGINDAYIRISYLDHLHSYQGMISYQYPATYFIKIKKNHPNPVQILMHELVHLRQFYTGELQQSGEKSVMYMGSEIDLGHIPYPKRPFEISAFKQTPLLLKEYRKSKNSAL